MPEYLGYVNPATVKANPTLDWSSVINDVRDTLVQQEAERESTRQRMAKETNELSNNLNKISLGQNQGINAFLTKGVYKAKDALLENDKLYRSGKITKEQFNIIKGNLQNGFNDLNSLAKGLNDDYNKYVELSQSGKLSLIADYNQNEKGKALDISNKDLYVDPTTGSTYVATIDKDGLPDYSKLYNPAWLNNNPSYFTPKVDVLSEVSKYTKDLGKFEYVLKNPPAGGIWTTDNIADKKEFNDWLEDVANAVASDPVRMTSILGDYAKTHTLTDDVKNTSPDKIVMSRDLTTGMNTPVLTKEQKEEAKKNVKEAVLVQVNKTLKQQEGTWHGFAPNAPKEPKDQSKVPYVGEISYINKGNKTIGKVVPISGVTIKRSPGVVEQVNRVGVSNGKLFIAYTVYNGSTSISDEDAGTKGTYKDKEERIIYEDKDRNAINERLRFVGNGFDNIDSARSYFGYGPAKNQSKSQSVPKVGSVVEGYKFLGGDPANPKSWKKI